MHSTILHTLLSHLVELTSERDQIELEKLLTQTLFDLISLESRDHDQPSVSIYHAVDIEKQIFPIVALSQEAEEANLPSSLKNNLANCFKSGECLSYTPNGKVFTHLYPLKSAAHQPIAIVAITSEIEDPQQQISIRMLLQMFQNFTWLNHDNERDTLTGLLNRKSFEQRISKVLAHISNTSKRKDDTICHTYFLAIFDIDHFKHVNDTFGHLIGDEVLLLFSQLMTQTFRDTDMLFRFGGEEFIGVFQCTLASDIETVLERFRVKISNFKFPQIGKVTASAGYTLISADEISSKLIDRADTALYFAKNNGRNRNCYYDQLITDGLLQENTKESDVEFF
ncbi:putative diguanylate cyclase YdaM [mine drainage metagenome]|uniref:Putative diguanylate cyclase YdaM n=1 Tax=mine drainage metagenome TaxID=410659 RepID=A0A1J5R1E0_9ZZZZ